MVLRRTRWLIATVVITLVVLTVIAGLGSRTPKLKQIVIETLSERLDSAVELESFSVDLFPTVHVTGTNLIIKHKSRSDVPPLVTVRSFSLHGGLAGLLTRPRRFRSVTLTGLQINIPPGGFHSDQPSPGDASPTAPDERPTPRKGVKRDLAAVLVERLIAEDATLALIPSRPGKEPRIFAIHHLTIESLGRGQAMPFTAKITNPVPKGIVDASGTFGPWQPIEPGATPVSGRYTFNNVDLATIKGIAGALNSKGIFGGSLGRIAVSGETHSPDFQVRVGSHGVPLDTTFDAVVDGTDGDTYLNTVSGRFLQTALSAKGAIVGTEGRKGRTIDLDVKIADGRIQDVLALAVKGERPVMTGRLVLHSDMKLPAGEADVIDRLSLAGEFAVAAARFEDPAVRAKLASMSQRARGQDSDAAPPESVATNLRGRFTLRGGTLNLPDFSFEIPGATVRMAGTYGLESEQLAFDGTLRMQATISEAAGGGMKSVLLKVVDPVFKKNGAGAVVPIRIRGTRSDPKFAVDIGKVLKR